MINDDDEETVIFADERLREEDDVYFVISVLSEGDEVSISN